MRSSVVRILDLACYIDVNRGVTVVITWTCLVEQIVLQLRQHFDLLFTMWDDRPTRRRVLHEQTYVVWKIQTMCGFEFLSQLELL